MDTQSKSGWKGRGTTGATGITSRRWGATNVRSQRRGATMIEFTMLGIPAIFLFLSIMSAAVDMWQFFTLSYAVGQTARYASVHGAGCTTGTNSCTITQANVASYFETQALALIPASTTMTMNDGSGVITCTPVTSCPSPTAVFPSSGHNTAGANTVSVSASYTLTDPIAMFWPSAGSLIPRTWTVKAASTQEVLF